LAVLELQKAVEKCLTTFCRKLKKGVFLAAEHGIKWIFLQKCVPGRRVWNQPNVSA
jgi:hypothetical protein